jgi:protease-4
MKRLLIAFAVLVGIAIAAAVAGIAAAGRSRPLGGHGSTVLVWRVDRPVIEQEADSAFPFGGRSSVDSIAELYPAFRAARSDGAVRGLAVYVEGADMGLAKAEELRRQMRALQAAGKFVECYMDTVGEGGNGTLDYFLASACDHIQMSPAGDLNLLGMLVDSRFLRGTFDKLKIDPSFSHVGEYKSYAETYTETQYSPAAARALNAVLDSLYGQLVSGVAEARRLTPSAVRGLIDGAPYTAAEAKARGLIDRIGYPDEFRDRIRRLAGGRPRLVRLESYGGGGGLSGRRLAVVFADGEIHRGRAASSPFGGDPSIGSQDLAETLHQVAEDDGIPAVVLRVNSPGGSALASDLILHEVERLERRKPVVVSMSDYAASGGYYIAARANRIVAEAATLTGSIGVVGGKFATRRFEHDLLGITHDELKRGANADLYASTDPFSPEQTARVEHLMRDVYDLFVGHVAAGRHMTRQAVDAIAGGRVWTGVDARPIGLVDEIGGLDRAVELAKKAAGLPAGEPVRLEFFPHPRSWFEALRDRREPPLPEALLRFVRALERRSPEMLELPLEERRLARPF